MIGVVGYVLLRLDFHPAPILLGFVLGPRLEENFRRAMIVSRGDLRVFIDRPISATFLGIAVLLVLAQVFFYVRKVRIAGSIPATATDSP